MQEFARLLYNTQGSSASFLSFRFNFPTTTNMGRSSKPSPEKGAPRPQQKAVRKHDDYTSDGVVDADVFLLPVSDYQVMIFVTVLAAIVRLFRIYQPSSVVFDEVQYVLHTK